MRLAGRASGSASDDRKARPHRVVGCPSLSRPRGTHAGDEPGTAEASDSPGERRMQQPPEHEKRP